MNNTHTLNEKNSNPPKNDKNSKITKIKQFFKKTGYGFYIYIIIQIIHTIIPFPIFYFSPSLIINKFKI